MTTTYAPTYHEALALQRSLRTANPESTVTIDIAYGVGYNVVVVEVDEHGAHYDECRCDECESRAGERQDARESFR